MQIDGLNKITGIVIDEALRLHRNLGPGLLESVYEMILYRALEKRGLYVERQKLLSFEYDGILFEEAFRLDLLVERSVIVELKSTERCQPVHAKKVLTYLRLLNLRVGLLINFGQSTLKEGLERIING